MTDKKYNFEPDYKKWWSKKNLNKEQLCWLLLGVNPDDVTKSALLKEGEMSDVEKSWKIDFFNYWDNLDCFIGKSHKQYLLLLKQYPISKIPQEAYRAYLNIADKFKEYLIKQEVVVVEPTLETFKNHNKYLIDFNSFNADLVQSKEEALSVLIGFQYEYFSKFLVLNERHVNEPKDEDGFTAYVRFSSEDRWFYSEYRKFIINQYKWFEHESAILKVYKAGIELIKWKDSFKIFCHDSYNEGFIFKKEILENIKDIDFTYSEDAWILKFYKRWKKENIWTLEESLKLFRGESPKEGERSVMDLSQNPWIYSVLKNNISAWEVFDDAYFEIQDRINKHISSEKITPVYHQETIYFEMDDIVSWLLENIPYRPPEAIIYLILNDESKSKYEREKPKRELEINQASTSEEKSKRKNELGAIIGKAIVSMGYKNKQAPSNDVWDYLKSNQGEYDCIQEITDKKIHWCSYRGHEQEMQRERFNNVVSNYNTGKKSYPDA